MSDATDYWADAADRQPGGRHDCCVRHRIRDRAITYMTDDIDGQIPRSQPFRRFQLVRNEDPTGVSGTGVVARGIEFPTGTAVIEWDAKNHDIDAENGLAIKPGPDGVAAVLEVHGHGGATQLNWLDTAGESAAGAESGD